MFVLQKYLKGFKKHFLKVNISEPSLRWKVWKLALNLSFGYFCTPKNEGFVYLIFSIMQKENQTPSVATFIDDLKFQGQDLKAETQEIINLFMETEQANDVQVREKALRCLYTIQQLHKAVFENE